MGQKMAIEQRGKWVRLPFEVRAEGGGVTVEGYAAVFNQEANIAGIFVEKIERGAFSEAIGRDEVVFLFNHNSDTVMARTSAGNLSLSEDERGLKISATLSEDDPDTQRLAAKMRAGNVNKMSFAFLPEVEEWDDSGDVPVRTIKRASLYDVSAVTEPAYDGTEIGLRSLETYRKENLKKAQAKANTAARYLRRMKQKAQQSPAFASDFRKSGPTKSS